MINEKRVIKQCIKGNKRFQRILYEKYSPRMYPVCYRYAKNTNDAQDILQETFITVFSKLDQFNNQGSFEGWIRKITVRCAIRHYQKNSKRTDNADIKHAEEQKINATILDEISAKEIIELIAELPDGYRIVFNLYSIEGYSHKEISETLGITESASRSQLTRARKLLIQKLEKIQTQLV